MDRPRLKNHQLETLRTFIQADNQKQNASIQLKADFPSLPCDVIDVDSRKAISSIVCEQPCGDQDLFNVIADQWLDPLSKNPKQRIALVGQTQIGKTQVLKNLIKHFLSFEKPQYDYVFYVSLEFVNCSDKMNILQFLTNQCSLRWIDYQSNTDHELFKRVVERINGFKQEKICIILDDLEKSNFHTTSTFITSRVLGRLKLAILFQIFWETGSEMVKKYCF